MFEDLYDENILLEEVLNEIAEDIHKSVDLEKVDLVHLKNYFSNRMSDDIEKEIAQSVNRQIHFVENHFSNFLTETQLEEMNDEDKLDFLHLLVDECRQFNSLLLDTYNENEDLKLDLADAKDLLKEARDEIEHLNLALEASNKQYMILLEQLANFSAMQTPIYYIPSEKPVTVNPPQTITVGTTLVPGSSTVQYVDKYNQIQKIQTPSVVYQPGFSSGIVLPKIRDNILTY